MKNAYECVCCVYISIKTKIAHFAVDSLESPHWSGNVRLHWGKQILAYRFRKHLDRHTQRKCYTGSKYSLTPSG